MDEVEIAIQLEVARLLSGIRYEYGLSPDEREDIEKQITERAGRWGLL